jgi:sec-independent protein translocase protein TatC
MFILPALTRREKRAVLLILPWVTIMFIGGAAFGYFVLIPPATQFLLSFGENIATPQLRIGNYVTFVARLMLAIGIVFELPVITTFLARLGLVNWRFLARQRRVAIVLAFVLAAVLTPTIDPVNQLLVAVPLILLYEAGIWLARLVQRPRVVEVPASEPV